MNWKRFNRGDCPVCNGARKDCRQNDNTGLVHCRDSDANPVDYLFRGLDTWGFGMWSYKPLSEAWAQTKKEEWIREQQRKRELEKRHLQEQRAKLLDDATRDRILRKILDQLSLTDKHREALHRRGLTEDQIKAGYFRSVTQWQKLDFPVDDRLAGVKLGGRSLLTPDSGILCPIPNHKGQLVGWQLRCDNNDDNKYVWAAGEKKRKNRPTSHLTNGELPLALWQPLESSTTDVVGLTEGISPKPYIASCRLKIPVVGAAGGNFALSPLTFKQSLEAVGAKEIILYPDAGAVLNPNVLRSYEKTFKLLLEWGYTVKVAWWGQVDKASGDIDEIDQDNITRITYLSPEEFLELAQKEQYKKQCWDNWKEAKKFTPQVKINKRFFEYGLPQSNTITFIKSGLGTGKTTELIQWLKQLDGYGVISLGYRNTLLLQFCEKAKHLGFYHLQSNKHRPDCDLADPTIRVTNCVDSLHYYQPEYFDGKILVIDEVVSVLKHLLYSETIKQFNLVKELFTEAIKRADRVICLDGLMQDWVVSFFKEICPAKQIVTVENIWKGDKAKIYLLEGTIDIDKKVKANDRSPWIQKLLNDSAIPFVCSDSQVFLEALENLLIEQGRGAGIRIDSKTVSEEHVKDFFKDPDKYIKENQPKYVLCSPTTESGLDIPTQNYFTEHIGFFFGCLDTDAIIQMLGRVRDSSVPKFVWCKKFVSPEPGDSNSRSSNVQAIEAQRYRNLVKELHLAFNNISSPREKNAYIQRVYQQNVDIYSQTADQIQAIQNHERSNLRECLRVSLIDNGYPVEMLTPETLANQKDYAKIEKEAKQKVKLQNSTDIYKASDRYVGVKEDVLLNFDASWEKRCEVIKAQLIRWLPGINTTSLWSPKFIKLIKYDEPKLIKQTELYWLLHHHDVAKRMAQEKYHKIFERGRDQEKIAPWKLRQQYLLVKTLLDIGLLDLVQKFIDNPGFTCTTASPEIEQMIAKCRQKKVSQVLGLPGKDVIKYVGKLIRMIGLTWQSRQVKPPGATVPCRVYFVDQRSLFSLERKAILNCLDRKFSRYLEDKQEALEWVLDVSEISQNHSLEIDTEKTAEIVDPQGLELVTLSTLFSIKNKVESVTKNQPDSLVDPEIDPLDSEEAIAEFAELLNFVDSRDSLAELMGLLGFLTRSRLNRAWRKLDRDKRQQIKIWARGIEAS